MDDAASKLAVCTLSSSPAAISEGMFTERRLSDFSEYLKYRSCFCIMRMVYIEALSWFDLLGIEELYRKYIQGIDGWMSLVIGGSSGSL